MPDFSYIARDIKDGKAVKGSMVAESEQALADRLRATGFILIKAHLGSAEKKIGKSGKVRSKDIITFTYHLATFLDAGIPLLEGLFDLAKTAGSEKMRGIISDISQKVKGGSSLSEALSSHSKIFSPLYIGLVKAGESTGKLDTVLVNIASYLEWQQELRSKIKEASTYPIILLCVMFGVVALLVGKVVPTFKPFFEQAGVALPLPTQIVLNASDIFRSYWYIIAIILIALVIMLKIYYKTEGGKYIIDSLKLKIPLVGELIRKVCLSRFAHTLSLSLSSGVPLMEAMETSARTIGNVKISKAVETAQKSVNVGEGLASSLERSNEFPPITIRMINIGEKSGRLVESLEKISQFYDKEVPSVINRLFTLMEPLMIVIIGVVVGGIALAVFLPLFRIAQTIGG